MSSFSRDINTHIKDVAHIIKAPKIAGLSLKLRKYRFFIQDVEYSGHVVKPGELLIHPKKTGTLAEARARRTRTHLCPF